MKKTKPHIATMRTQYAENQQCIRAALKMSQDEYNNQWLDLGRGFLNQHYPKNDVKYVGYHSRLATDPIYWRWWLAEWKQKEAYALRIFEGQYEKLDYQDYLSVMACLLDDSRVETSFFENYLYKLKFIQNGSNPNNNQTNKRTKSRRRVTQPIC